MTRRRRVLVLEDDAMIRRFIGMALAELPIELTHAPCIAELWRQLEPGGADLLISDLMLPDGHAMDVFRALRQDPSHARLPIVILSAGLTAAVHAQAAELKVFRVLEKPVPYADLIACVEQALDAGRIVASAAPPDAASRLGATQRERAIADHFGGRASLFDEFFASCVAQLPLDVEAGDRACVAGDAAALRRVAHNLKAVLLLIGDTEAHVLARRLEQAAAAHQAQATLDADWRRLRSRVDALCRAAG